MHANLEPTLQLYYFAHETETVLIPVLGTFAKPELPIFKNKT